MDLNDPRLPKTLSWFRTERNRTRSIISKAKENSWTSFVEGINSNASVSDIWGRVGALQGRYKVPKFYIKTNNSTTDDPQIVAETLADYYMSVSNTTSASQEGLTADDNANQIDSDLETTDSAEYNKDFTLRELSWALRKCTSKGTGLDGIGYPLLRNLPLRGKVSVLQTMNNIWKSGKIPQMWKHAMVIPLPKPNRKEGNPDEYRPISLINCIAKVLERLVNRRLISELEEKEILNGNQYAFRAGLGTDVYFAELEGFLDAPLKEGKHCEMLSLDISKAYDTVNRGAIIDSLLNMNITGRMFRYLKDFLSDRTFRVRVGAIESTIRSTNRGIPQGSVISVTLFLIATNPLFDVIPKNVKCYVYADDILLVAYGVYRKCLRKKIQRAAECALEWLSSVDFKVSVPKYQLLHVCHNNRHRGAVPNIKLDNISIPTVKQMKILGVFLDHKLTFEKHAGARRSAASGALNILKMIAGKVRGSRKILVRLVHSLMVPRLLYGFSIASRKKEKVLPIISPIYNKAMRIASGAFPTSPIKAVMCEAGQLPLDYLSTLFEAKTAVRLMEMQRISPELALVERVSRSFAAVTGSDFPKVTYLWRIGPQKWNHQALKVDWSVQRLVKAGDNPVKALAAYKTIINDKYIDYYKMFTDGSKKEGTVGFGVYSESEEICGRINDECSVFSAEVMAICTAIRDAPENQKTAIFSDSASSIRAIEAGTSRNPWIQACEDAALNKDIILVWVPGHVGIPGNEAADSLADEGRNSDMVYEKVPRLDANRFIKRKIWEAWQGEWSSCNPGTQLNKIKEKVAKWKDRVDHYEQRALTRIRIGHSLLTHSYILTPYQDSPLCSSCNENLSIKHLLLECKNTEMERKKYYQDKELKDLLKNDKEQEEKVIKFIKEIGLMKKL